MGKILYNIDLPSESATDIVERYSSEDGNKLKAGRRAMNLLRGLLGGAKSGQVDVLSGSVKASSTITAVEAAADNTVVVNGVTFTAKVSPSGDQQFALGSSDQAALENLAAKINASALAGVLGVVTAELTTSEVAESTLITTVADVADSLDGTSFIISDEDGTVGVWIDVDNSGTTIPAGAAAADRAIEITTIATGDAASVVATKIAAVLEADSKFTASADGAVITVNRIEGGTSVDAEDSAGGEATGFTFAVDTQGVDPVCTISAAQPGLIGNAITLSATGGFSAGAAKLAGGTDGTKKTFYFGSSPQG